MYIHLISIFTFFADLPGAPPGTLVIQRVLQQPDVSSATSGRCYVLIVLNIILLPVFVFLGGEVPFGGAPGYVAVVAAAAHSHLVKQRAHSQPPPPTHAQAGSVSAAQTGSMRTSLHHPSASGPFQGRPPQQQAPLHTFTPPGASP